MIFEIVSLPSSQDTHTVEQINGQTSTGQAFRATSAEVDQSSSPHTALNALLNNFLAFWKLFDAQILPLSPWLSSFILSHIITFFHFSWTSDTKIGIGPACSPQPFDSLRSDWLFRAVKISSHLSDIKSQLSCLYVTLETRWLVIRTMNSATWHQLVHHLSYFAETLYDRTNNSLSNTATEYMYNSYWCVKYHYAHRMSYFGNEVYLLILDYSSAQEMGAVYFNV